MLRFSRPELIVNSLLSLTMAELQALCCDSAGSHVVTAFVNSPTVTQRSQLYTLLKVMCCPCLSVYLSVCLSACQLFEFSVNWDQDFSCCCHDEPIRQFLYQEVDALMRWGIQPASHSLERHLWCQSSHWNDTDVPLPTLGMIEVTVQLSCGQIGDVSQTKKLCMSVYELVQGFSSKQLLPPNNKWHISSLFEYTHTLT